MISNFQDFTEPNADSADVKIFEDRVICSLCGLPFRVNAEEDRKHSVTITFADPDLKSSRWHYCYNRNCPHKHLSPKES